MANIDICDRCDGELHKEAYQRGIIARLRKPLWKLSRVTPMKSGFMDMWEVNRYEIDLCQKCTKEFFKFTKKRK